MSGKSNKKVERAHIKSVGTPISMAGFIVKREGILARINAVRRREGLAGIALVTAPSGFGKTALLIQYVGQAQEDPGRCGAVLKSAAAMSFEDLRADLERTATEFNPKLHPLVAIDDAPMLTEAQGILLNALLARLVRRGFEFMISTIPSNTGLIETMEGAVRIESREMLVHANEYHDWAGMFQIAPDVDVYKLTQGIPALIVALKSLTDERRGSESLKMGVRSVYKSVLSELRRSRDAAYRLACMFLLMGKGTLADLERCGVRIHMDLLARMVRDYPVFGYEPAARSFECLEATDSETLSTIRGEIASRRPAYAVRAVKALIRSGEVDRAVALAAEHLSYVDCLGIIEQHPALLTLCGHGRFIRKAMLGAGNEAVAAAGPGVAVALLLASLTMGEYRAARAACTDLRRRANEIASSVTAEDWECACAALEIWDGCQGLSLPEVALLAGEAKTGAAACLRRYAQGYRRLVGGDGGMFEEPLQKLGAPCGAAIYVPGVFSLMFSTLSQALHGDGLVMLDVLGDMDAMAGRLHEAGLLALEVRMRSAISVVRLMAGMPVVDERAFVDAGTIAIRESDLATQLFCLCAEGWQSAAMGQVTNARFRSQQILRLSDERQGFLRSWAGLLEKVTALQNAPIISIRDEAECLELTSEEPDSSTAWVVALHLSAARFDADLSAWFSLHRACLLNRSFMPIARLAMHVLGHKADSVRRLIPAEDTERYILNDEERRRAEAPVFDVISGALDDTVLGRVDINLFGGLRVVRNGHVLTEEVWRRKKAGILAARLTLSLGSFVGRKTIMEEFWPQSEYRRARGNLYSATSGLRHAFRQDENGPQYLVTQGDGLGLNPEFVSSDTLRFDLLAREILLPHAGASAKSSVENCLRLEQIYCGPLFVPDNTDTTYFTRMRRSYQSRFIDCMLRGIDAAIEQDDTSTASWLVEATMKHAPTREDVVRHAMTVYAASGRRREIVEMYQSHLHFLSTTLHTVPEDETRALYEELVQEAKQQAFL